MTAAGRWADALERRAIPAAIVDAAPRSPWGFPPELFRERGRTAAARPVATPTTARAIDALGRKGTVLDVGVGAGATSLPLASRARLITGFDQQEDMLAAFVEAAEGSFPEASGSRVETVRGTWPADSHLAPDADVFVSGHTIYNVSDLVAFVEALCTHAMRRVVLEATDRHPLGWMHDLWRRFHDLDMPDAPSIELAIEVLESMGIHARTQERRETDDNPSGGGFGTRQSAVATVRTRLCLTPDRDGELADAMGERLRVRNGLWTAGPLSRTIVTLWWDVDARPPG